MDSNLLLAILQKSRQIYEDKKTDVFLSFPATQPITFKKDALDFFDESKDPKTALNDEAEFAKLVNRIPEGMRWTDSEDRPFLWDAYFDILERARTAVSLRSEAEEIDYQAQLDILYDQDEDGFRVPSSEYAKYQQFKDQSFILLEQLKSGAIDADLSEDPGVKKRWNDVTLPKLQREIDENEQQWRVAGFKEKIQTAIDVERSLASKSPSLTWDTWKKKFQPLIDLDTDLQKIPFAPSSYIPLNAVADDSWISFEVTREAAKKLARNAPEELRATLGGEDGIDSSVVSLRFEYSSAKVMRHWFTPDVLKSRFFKYESLISSGTGDSEEPEVLPAYVSAVIFARDITVKRRVPVGQPMLMAKTIFKPIQGFTFNVPTAQAKLLRPKFVAPTVKATIKRRDNRTLSVRRATVRAKQRRQLGRKPSNAKATATLQPIFMPMQVAEFKVPPTAKVNRGSIKHIKDFVLHDKIKAHADLVGAGQTSKTKIVTEKLSGDSIFVLAFVCRRVPRSPNPDNALKWE